MKKLILIFAVVSLVNGCSTSNNQPTKRICELNKKMLKDDLFEESELFEVQRLAIEKALEEKYNKQAKIVDDEDKEVEQLLKEVVEGINESIESGFYSKETAEKLRNSINQMGANHEN